MVCKVLYNSDQTAELIKYITLLREAIVQKIPEFYEMISQTGGGGAIGFHISYSEIVNTPKSVAKSE